MGHTYHMIVLKMFSYNKTLTRNVDVSKVWKDSYDRSKSFSRMVQEFQSNRD